MIDPPDHLMLRALLAYGLLLVGAVVSVMLIHQRELRRSRRTLESRRVDVQPGDRVLTNFGFEASVVSVDDQVAVLRIGAGQEQRTITAERGAIIRKITEAAASR